MERMEESPRYEYKRGQTPLKKIVGEEVTALRFMLPISQLEYLKARAAADKIPMAEYLRRLIAADMTRP